MILNATGAWKGSFGYSGSVGYQEDETGLELLGARYYDPTTGRFLTRDTAQDGRNWYVYCANNPLCRVDSSGDTWVYLRDLGELWYLDDKTGKATLVSKGYSGAKGHRDPACDLEKDQGPIPDGIYDIGGSTNSKGPMTIRLDPEKGTDTHGRGDFRIHGDNKKRDASTGCIIVGPEARRKILKSKDKKLLVMDANPKKKKNRHKKEKKKGGGTSKAPKPKNSKPKESAR